VVELEPNTFAFYANFLPTSTHFDAAQQHYGMPGQSRSGNPVDPGLSLKLDGAELGFLPAFPMMLALLNGV
jgi:hypothetical protein